MAVLVSGCASSGSTPLGASMSAILFGGDTHAEAQALPYASLDASIGDIQGLLVLGTQAGDMTYWPAREGVILELSDGGLHAFRGPNTRLLGSTYQPAAPWQLIPLTSVTLTRHVEDATGDMQRYQASGTLHCDPTRLTALPLGERHLEPCHIEWHWTTGDTTSATYWRDPETHRLWAAAETPWPDAPDVTWRVARHWW